MNSIKCFHCGLVNWDTASECKRCRAALLAESPEETRYEPQYAMKYALAEPRPKPWFSGGIQLLTTLLGVGGLAALLSAIGVISGELASIVGASIGLAGLVLLLVTHIWLVVRIFEQSAMWGLLSLFVPVVGLIAVIKFWETTKRSFVGQFICYGILLTGMFTGNTIHR